MLTSCTGCYRVKEDSPVQEEGSIVDIGIINVD
jgi:hypothetical protein